MPKINDWKYSKSGKAIKTNIGKIRDGTKVIINDDVYTVNVRDDGNGYEFYISSEHSDPNYNEGRGIHECLDFISEIKDK